MTKKLLITLSILTLFANATKASDNNSATHDEGVVINGIRWATRNVDMPGTFAETPESFGMLFQWNRKKAWSAVEEDVEGWDSSICESPVWEKENDPCPEGWRVPTKEELKCLIRIQLEIHHQDDREGRFRNDQFGRDNWLNGFGVSLNKINLPKAGWRDANGVYHNLTRIGTQANYWSSTQDSEGGKWSLFFVRRNLMLRPLQTAHALSVRCVAK